MDVPLYFGQRMSPAVRDRGVMLERVVRANPALEEAIDAGVEVELGMSVWGAFRPGPVMRELGSACVGVADQTRSWLVGYDQLIVAAGARDLNLAFRGWEKAGTMGAAAALALLTRYQALAARRMVILGSGPLALAVATLARARGIEVPAIVEVSPALRGDARPRAGSSRTACASTRGTWSPRRSGAATSSRECASPRSTRPPGDPGGAPEIACDTVCLAVGLIPQIELLQILGCRLAFRSERGGFVPEIDDDQRTSSATSSRPATSRASTSARAGAGARDRRRAARRGGRGRGARDDRAGPAQALLRETPVPPLAPAPRAHDYWRQWLQATLAAGGWDILACQCEEVTRGELVGVQPPRYLGPRSAPMQARNSARSSRTGRPIRTR